MPLKAQLRDREDIVLRRLQNQGLLGKPFTRPEQVVARHLAMQSQDFGGAKWAIGQRLAVPTEASVDDAFQRGEILRTHVLRPTWHFVTPADIRWLLELTAPRIKAGSAPYFRKHGLEPASLRRSRRVLEQQLAGRQLTREELSVPLAEAGLPVLGEALSYQMIAAELDGVICSGARRGKQHTYALLEERVAKTTPLGRDEALAQLGLRYLQGHGPALVQDLAWWSGLTVADAKRAVAACRDRLCSAEVTGRTYWFAALGRAAPLAGPAVHLLPNYDEQLIAYRFRGNAIDPAVAPRVGRGDGVFDGHFVTIDGKLVGSWRRQLGKTHVSVQAALLRRPSRAEQRELRAAAQRYADFLALKLELSVTER
jgi:hypothetical protein